MYFDEYMNISFSKTKMLSPEYDLKFFFSMIMIMTFGIKN